MAFYDRFLSGGRKTAGVTKAQRVLDALSERFPEHAQRQGFVVEYTPDRVGGQGVYHVRTTLAFSRSNWTGMGLTQSTETEIGDFTRRSEGMLLCFDIREVALEKALGLGGPGAAPNV